jgi:cell division septal protein FtsQ
MIYNATTVGWCEKAEKMLIGSSLVVRQSKEGERRREAQPRNKEYISFHTFFVFFVLFVAISILLLVLFLFVIVSFFQSVIRTIRVGRQMKK